MDPQLESILREISEKTGLKISFEPFPEGTPQTRVELASGARTEEVYLPGGGEDAENAGKLLSYIVSAAERQPLGDRQDMLRGILRGEGGSWHTYRYLSGFRLADAPCYVVLLCAEKLMDEILAQVEGCIDGPWETAVRMDETHTAVVKRPDGEQSPYEFGEFLAQSLFEELGVRVSVGVGCEMSSFHEIAAAYEQAEAALRMGRLFHGEGGVHSYREFMLVRLLEAVPKSRIEHISEQLHAENLDEVLDDEELCRPAEVFLDCNLNISEASRALFMHRNTLSYRLDKIARLTGLDIRKFSDAVTFRVITVLKRIVSL